jgi:hypothetical protein
MIAYTVVEVVPKRTIEIGTHETDGNCCRALSTGRTNDRTGRTIATNIPRGVAIAIDMRKPRTPRWRLFHIDDSKTPSDHSPPKASATIAGDGTSDVGFSSAQTINCHTARTPAVPNTKGFAESTIARHLDTDDNLSQRRGDFAFESVDRVGRRIAWIRLVDSPLRDDAAWT